jgi:hypothetical protein
MKKSFDCEHGNSKKGKAEKEFQGEIFEYKTNICRDCDASLWTNDTEVEYNHWLEGLQKNSKKRHLFQVQFSLTENSIKCLEKLRDRFPGVDLSLLMRALTMVYLEIVGNSEEMTAKIESYVESEDYQTLLIGPKESKKIQFLPNGMREILSVCDLFTIKPSKVIEEAINRMILLSINKDKEMKNFWEGTILKSVEIILKAA